MSGDDERLFALAPQFFKHKADLTRSLMGFGFNIGPGWKPLVEELSKYIAHKSKRWSEVVEIKKRLEGAEKNIEEDYPWITDYFKRYPSDPFIGFEIVQVKEKFGGLRFYCHGGTEEVHGAIHFAEQLSYRICEECGCPGELRTANRSWIRTLCDKHAKEA